jgi:hypothetical protein
MAFWLILAAAVGFAAGALTGWSVPHLPFYLEPLGNTAAPWVLVAFAVALGGRRVRESLVLAVVTLFTLVLGFYAAEALHGWPVSGHQVGLWSVACVVVGPVVGLAAGWFRHAGRTWRALGAGVLGGLLAGEAIYGHTALRFSSPADYWYVQFFVGVGLAVGLTLWRSCRDLLGTVQALAVSLAGCAMVGLGAIVAFQAI